MRPSRAELLSAALSLALVRQGRITSDVIWELKMQSLRKSGLLEMHRGTESLSGLGGLEAIKSFCLRALRSQSERAEPRGTVQHAVQTHD